MKMGLYDSDTGESLVAAKVADITELQTDYDRVLLAYTQAQRGRIVQVCRSYGEGDARIHYFFDEPGGIQMIKEDEERFGFQPGDLLKAVQQHAPV